MICIEDVALDSFRFFDQNLIALSTFQFSAKEVSLCAIPGPSPRCTREGRGLKLSKEQSC